MTQYPSKCPVCGTRAVRERTGRGRTTPYRMIPSLDLPPTLPIPTCGRCQSLFLARMEPEFVAEQLRQTFQQSLRVRVKTALCSLKQFVSWRQLEVKLGLSQGYLSKLRLSSANPSPELTVLLALLAMDPTLLSEIDLFWLIPDSVWIPKSQVADALERRRMRGEAHRHAEICARTDLVALIGQYVTLVPEGKNFVGPCPFHNDPLSSLKVSVEGRFYYCFGCHASGDAVQFLMAKEQRSLSDVLSDLAQRAGMLPISSDGRSDREGRGSREPLYRR